MDEFEKFGYGQDVSGSTFPLLGEYSRPITYSAHCMATVLTGWNGHTVLLEAKSKEEADLSSLNENHNLWHIFDLYDKSIGGLYLIGFWWENPTFGYVAKRFSTGLESNLEHIGDTRYNNDIRDIHNWLIDLRQNAWRGQSYTEIDDILQKLLFAKFYAERNRVPFSPYNYHKVYEQARDQYNSNNQVDIGSLRSGCDRIVSELMKYRLSGNQQIWHIINHLWTTKSLRREDGQYFTPYGIKRFMIEIHPPAKGDKVCDPCGGSGGFIVQAADNLPDFDPKDFYYFELDSDRIFKVAQHTFNTYIHPITGNSLSGVNMFPENSLAGDWITKMDRIYTNVPFGLRIKDWERVNGNSLLNRYETGRGKKSELSQLLFIEQSLRHLEDGGTFATVVDKGIVTNLKYQEERAKIAEMAALELIVELPSVAFEHFSGTTFPTFLLFFRKAKPTYTRYEKIENVGYDGSSYKIRQENTGPFDFSLDELNYEASEFKDVVNRWNNRNWDKESDSTRDYDYSTTKTGTWLWGHWKNSGSKCKRLKDRAVLLLEKWDGNNSINPTVDRQYRYIRETHLNPKASAKTRTLREGALLISRLLSEKQTPACGFVHKKFDGAGCTNENYIINPNNENDLLTIWYRINFDKSTHEFLWDHCRGQGRGRIQEADFLNIPMADLNSEELAKASELIEILKKKAKLDDLIERRISAL